MESDTSESQPQPQTQTPPQDSMHADAVAQREAYEYWGYLIKPDKCGTDLFNRLLEGIAEVVRKTFEPSPSPDITPSQIAAFYRAVGGNYDVLFLETPPSSISFIYRSLGAFHSLQPAPDDDGYSSPSIPALKKKGFVTWQTIQLLLGPQEHVPFLQNAVSTFDVVDPQTGDVFPKLLPSECLPAHPDEAMVSWHEGVAARLRREAEDDAAEKEEKENAKENAKGPRVHVHIDEHGPRTSSEMSNDEYAEERQAAATYFADPLYRKDNRRPPISRHFSGGSRDGRRWGQEEEKNRGRLIISSVRHMFNPFGRDKRRSLPGGRYVDDEYSDDNVTPTVSQPQPAPRYTANVPYPSSHKRPHPKRRESTLSSTDSDSDSDHPPSRRRTPVLRTRISHEPPSTGRDYFPQYYEDKRYLHDVPPITPSRKEDGPPALYGPTKAPIFATHVAQIQAHSHYYPSSDSPRRPAMPPRTGYRPSPPNVHGVRYAVPPPDVHDPPYARERGREAYEPLSGNSRHRRRRSEDIPRERERRPDTGGRTRSHERMRDEWDERERSRGSSRDVSRDGGRRTHRYVPGVQDGVGGRKYPVEQAWVR
ncbi:hypothetical protein P280DRAFT_465932 [Massarina eburnea CBS 473.64]|uniref:DUF7514 domain-containing protein n=1 Tax=Massarina eburnea CBS 473.64 TaxID=1395130 RepID=A0A6A6SA65_9PLEO|nr:hypothetical protein P280DRAFT_465932 [Massarina eburnea CBS 473.64]